MKQKTLQIAISGALLFGTAGLAQASLYGFASNQIRDFTMTGVTILGGATSSESLAGWQPPVSSVSYADTMDATLSACGPTGCGALGLPSNDWSQTASSPPPAITENYARGDAKIINANITTGGAASNVAEVVAAAGQEVTLVNAQGTNAISGRFRATADTLAISFEANPFLEVWTPVGDPLWIWNVQSNIQFSISITTASNSPVFSWTPDGTETPTGAGTVSEAFSLNVGLPSFDGTGNGCYDSGLQGPQVCPTPPALYGNFSADVPMTIGDVYAFNIEAKEGASGGRLRRPQVPVPATIALLGAGLFGIGAVRRRLAKV
jgi:hypothetical protein